MIDFGQILSPALALVIVGAAGWHVCSQRGGRIRVRTRQITEAADLLNKHAHSLEVFLEDETAPAILKDLLVKFSDIMEDKDTVARLTEWVATRPLDQPADTDEMKAVSEAMSDLRARNPDLAEKFDVAILTAVAGASLRWTESAALFECTFPRLVTTHKRDVTIAVTVAHLRPGIPFSVKPVAVVAVA
ncbi:hypothetical protein [Acidisphaera sp. S103]|uniref:hypothetical protein n=1 Tax=Acidisphaera sp. S103 TaxID=1747223 RepID=UPI00131D41EC|nr:hypothetical protein [Acidisphaera sp. S103]